MVEQRDVFLAVVACALMMIVVGAGVIEMLKRIEKAIIDNYQASLARAMSTTDIAVKPEKEKIREECVCGHAKAVHWTQLEGGKVKPGEGACHSLLSGTMICHCLKYAPRRGPWPGEVKV